MQETLPEHAPVPPRRATWVAGVTLVLLGIGGLAAWGITRPGAVSFFVTPSDVAAQPPDGRSLRVGGRVADGTLQRDGAAVAFTITDGRHEVRVRYAGEVPDTLKEKTDVVAEGTIDRGGTLVATRVLAKCSSRFVPKIERDARAASRP